MLVICAYIHIKLRLSDQSVNTALPLEKEMVERLSAILIVMVFFGSCNFRWPCWHMKLRVTLSFYNLTSICEKRCRTDLIMCKRFCFNKLCYMCITLKEILHCIPICFIISHALTTIVVTCRWWAILCSILK